MRACAPHSLAVATLALLAAVVTNALADPCVLPDNGTGTVTLPDPSCGYISPSDFHMIVDGLPPGTEIVVGAEHRGFLCGQGLPQDSCSTVGPAGEVLENFDSTLHMVMNGTGDLATFHREIDVPIQCQAQTGPRVAGDPVQEFDTEMLALQGGLFGDPDFDNLTITGGAAFGLPSPGHTTLTRLGPPGSSFSVDSFFDIEYRIDFVGAPGSVLTGMSGSTLGTVRMQSGDSAATSVDAGVQSSSWGRVKTMYQD